MGDQLMADDAGTDLEEVPEQVPKDSHRERQADQEAVSEKE